MMNTMKRMNKTELTLDELEMVNGGVDWDKACGFGWFGGSVGMAAASIGLMCCGPIGWGALDIMAGGAAVGAAVGGGITAAATADD